MDEDFEDLLRDSGDLDAEFSSPEKPSSSKLPDINVRLNLNIDEKAIPSANEIRLGKRVMELEKERDALLAEITSLKSQQPLPAHPTIPIPTSTSIPTAHSNPDTNSPNEPVVIPAPLIPVLAILRTHISELTRDNQALRYTFLGPNPPSRGTIKPAQNPIVPSPLPVPTSTAPPAGSIPISTAASSSKVTLDVDMIPSPSPGAGIGIGTQNPLSPSVATVAGGTEDTDKSGTVGLSQIDLEKVLDRVKELVKENEELGEMILESGRREGLEKALEDSRNVISSLDSDLTHHLTLVESLRTEISSYKSHFGPIPSSTLNVPSKHPISSNASTPTRPSHRDRDRERENREGSSHSHSHSRRDDKRNGEGAARRHDNHPSNRGGVTSNRDRERSNGNGRGIPSGPSGSRNGNGVKEDDRAYKRRR